VLVSLSASAEISRVTDRLDAAPESPPRLFAEAVQDLRSQLTLKGKTPNVITSDGRDSAFLIPIAGNVAGANGTYFRSDVTISNYRSAKQNISIGWLAQGQNNNTSPLQRFTIPANTTAVLNDFVGTTLGKTGLGAIAVFADDSAGNVDVSGRLDGASRIWTLQPGVNGTVSQSFDAVSLLDSLGSLTAYVIGLKQSSAFRTNVGVVNLDTVPHTWTIRSIATGVITTVTVQASSVSQVTLAAGSTNGSGAVNVSMQSDGFGFWWSAYGTSVDNVTGDGWVERAKQ
jgi:hypothetical protein